MDFNQKILIQYRLTFYRLIFLIFTFISLSPAAFANSVSVNSVINASNFVIGTGTTSTVIYGGIVGTLVGGCASPSTNSTCNNCSDPDLACNRNRIHPTLRLRINFTVTADLKGNVWFGYNNAGSVTEFISYGGKGAAVSKGSSAFVEIDWREVCTAVGASSGPDCDTTQIGRDLIIAVTSSSTPTTAERTIVKVSIHQPSSIDVNGLICTDTTPSVGVCYFEAFPGDGKVYIEELVIRGTFPVSSGLSLSKLRVFFSEAPSYPGYESETWVDLNINNDGDVVPNVVGGLSNETLYYFRVAVVDLAKNIAFMSIPSSTSAPANPAVPLECDTLANAAEEAICGIASRPSKVFGLLPEDFNCFISTAAFGSAFAPQVEIFRKFRDEFLLTNFLGRQFTEYYYKYSPPLARYIYQNKVARFFTRLGLYPFWAYAWISLKLGPLMAFLAFLITLGAPIFIWQLHRSTTRKASPIKSRVIP